MKRLARAWLGRLGNALGLQRLAGQVENASLLAGRLLARQVEDVEPGAGLDAVEFKVFSQFGEDGILQYLARRCGLPRELHTFVEFGVSDYEESNTRFLLMSDNWRGMVLDGSADNIAQIRSRPWFWRHDLTAVPAFVTAENIDGLISAHGYAGEIGLLSIDIDGNDYWVWRAIRSVNPVIVVAEYNSLLGGEHPVTVPYDAAFQRGRAHYSNLYWGASLPALERVAREKGYVCVGSNSAGNNVFFIRQDFAGKVRPVTAAQAYVQSRFRESRDAAGTLTFLPWTERLKLIRALPLYHVDRRETVSVGELYGV